MKILVPIKRVADPDNANKVKVNGATISSDGLEWKMNPFDEWALEAALRLTEDGKSKERKGEVVLVSIGPKDAATTIRQGLAMGAERGIMIEGDDNLLDGSIVAAALAKVVEAEKPDLIVMGKQAVDGDSNVVGTFLSELAGLPIANYATKIVTADGGKTVTVARETDAGTATVKVTGPAIITVTDRILHPDAVKNGITAADFSYPAAEGGRYASLKGIMAAKKKPMGTLDAAALAVSADAIAPKTARTAMAPPADRPPVTLIQGDAATQAKELIRLLHEEAKVI